MSKETIRQKRARFDRTQAKGIAIARQVSTLLRKAGFQKSGGYHSFHYREPGYQVAESGNGTRRKPTAVVMWCNAPHGAASWEHDMMAAIAADPRFEVNGRNVTRVDHAVEHVDGCDCWRCEKAAI
jgi:hypothetical protein